MKLLSGLKRFASRFMPATKDDVRKLMNLNDSITALTGAVNNNTAAVNAAIAINAGASPEQLAALGTQIDIINANNLALATANAAKTTIVPPANTPA